MMYRTSQKCLKQCRCVSHAALGGLGVREHTCKGKSDRSDWKRDCRLDVLMKELSELSEHLLSRAGSAGLGGTSNSLPEHS